MSIQYLRECFGALWRVVRELATDDAYERYLNHHQRTHSGQTPLDRRAFYEHQQQRKWSGVKRCC